MSILVKICGLKTADSVDVALDNGADLLGFNFFERTPRHVSISDAAILTSRVGDRAERVGLMVDPGDDFIQTIVNQVSLDVVQLHGTETPERVAHVKDRFGLPVMKACAISGADDIAVARTYEGVADRFLFDAKPPKGANRPGGNAVIFDWQVLADETWSCPWLLAGGLTPENVAEAIRTSGAPGVDVSSGVEDSPGEKNVDKIAAFLQAAKS